MKLSLTTIPRSRRNCCSGMTMVELMIALGISSVILLAICSLTVFTARSFLALANYDSLERYSRSALDVMSREIRQTQTLIDYKTNRLVFQDHDGSTNLIYFWDPYNHVLSRQKAGSTTILLTNCDSLTFNVFQRHPKEKFTFYPATNNHTGQFDPTMCKLINVNWTCSREIRGVKANTESVQTAKIVMRN
jgi:prepilin-type N-terminal cleavage/methylation domain-containing protein